MAGEVVFCVLRQVLEQKGCSLRERKEIPQTLQVQVLEAPPRVEKRVIEIPPFGMVFWVFGLDVAEGVASEAGRM